MRLKNHWTKSAAILAALAGFLLFAGAVHGQAAASTAEVRERYARILDRRPAEGVALRAIIADYERAEGIAELVSFYRKRIEAEPENESNLIVIGLIFNATGKPAEALAPLSSAARKAPSNYFAHRALGDTLLAMDQPLEAAAAYEKAEKLAPDSRTRREVIELEAKANGRASKPQAALEALRRLAAEGPEDADLQAEVARSAAEAGFDAEAIAYYRKAIDLSKEDPSRRASVWRSIASIQRKAGRNAEALAAYGEALRLLAPDNYLRREIEVEVEEVYRRSGKLGELAQNVFKEASQNPADAEIWRRAARLAMEAGLNEKAVEAYGRALDAAPDSAPLVQEAVRVLTSEGRAADAARMLEKLMSRRGADAAVRLELAACYARLGRRGDAETILKSMLASDKLEDARAAAVEAERLAFDDVALSGWKRLAAEGAAADAIHYGELLYRGESDYSKSLGVKQWLLAAEKAGDDVNALGRAAENLIRAGQKVQALTIFERAAKLHPENLEIARRLA